MVMRKRTNKREELEWGTDRHFTGGFLAWMWVCNGGPRGLDGQKKGEGGGIMRTGEMKMNCRTLMIVILITTYALHVDVDDAFYNSYGTLLKRKCASEWEESVDIHLGNPQWNALNEMKCGLLFTS